MFVILLCFFEPLFLISWEQVKGLSLATVQIAIGTDDVYKTAEAVKLFGGKITREPGPLPGINTKITACLDPDGWKTVCLFSFWGQIHHLFLSWRTFETLSGFINI